MKRVLLILSAFTFAISCKSPHSSQNDALEDLTSQAKEDVANYCKHAYDDYEPMEWYSLRPENAMQDSDIATYLTTTRETAYEIQALREILGELKKKSPTVDLGEYANCSVDEVEQMVLKLKEKHRTNLSTYLKLIDEHEPSSYVIGHAYSHKVFGGRKIELHYFIWHPELGVISVKDEEPTKYKPIIPDFGPNV